MWIRFQRGSGSQTEWLPVTADELERWRAIVRGEFERRHGDQIPLGFEPRAFAVVAVEAHGVKLPGGLDGILLSYALFQSIGVATTASYESGPPKQMKRLPGVFPK